MKAIQFQGVRWREKLIGKLLVILIVTLSITAACTAASETQENADTGAENGALAMVDSVMVEQRDGNYYAVVSGNYPDPCTFMSSVEQTITGNTVNITLLNAGPTDLMCAAVLAPFTVDILLTTGGLMPEEYTVVVNDGATATFSIGLDN